MLFQLMLIVSLLNKDSTDWTWNGNLTTKEVVFEKYRNNQWEQWADENLQTGDIVFRGGQEYVFGVFDFSRYVRELTRSSYSHCGIIIRVLGRTYVFDNAKDGYRKIPWSMFLLECKGKILVKRLKDEYKDKIADAIHWCWYNYTKNTQFDYDFRMGNDKLYCAENVICAFKNSRLLLENPLKVSEQPGIDDHFVKNILVIGGSYWFSERPFRLDQKIYTAAGISKSRYLTTIFEGKL